MNKIVFKTKHGGFDIKLEQTSKQFFRVTYGRQIEGMLNYAEAAAKLGEAIMHASACEGLLDNSFEGG